MKKKSYIIAGIVLALALVLLSLAWAIVPATAYAGDSFHFTVTADIVWL